MCSLNSEVQSVLVNNPFNIEAASEVHMEGWIMLGCLKGTSFPFPERLQSSYQSCVQHSPYDEVKKLHISRGH